MSSLRGWEKSLIAGPGMVLVGLAALVWVGPGLWALANADSLTATMESKQQNEYAAVMAIGRKKYECPRALFGEDNPIIVHYDPANPDRCRTRAVLKRPTIVEGVAVLWTLGFVLMGILSTLVLGFRMLLGKGFKEDG